MDRSSDELLKEILAVLKQQHGLRYEQVIEAYEGVPTIPATCFATGLTPLETAALYLATHRKLERKEIAKLLGRSSSVIHNALRNAKSKGIVPKDDAQTPYRIPTGAFISGLSPAEAIVKHLHDRYRLPNKTIATLIGRDQRNTWKALRGAQ